MTAFEKYTNSTLEYFVSNKTQIKFNCERVGSLMLETDPGLTKKSTGFRISAATIKIKQEVQGILSLHRREKLWNYQVKLSTKF